MVLLEFVRQIRLMILPRKMAYANIKIGAYEQTVKQQKTTEVDSGFFLYVIKLLLVG
jgi:hypothetical protein